MAINHPAHGPRTAELAWLRQAVALASENAHQGDGPFGALIVRDDEVISTGVNQVTSTLDPTAHAEVLAIREASAKLRTIELSGCLLVSSCEPCPMCLAAALWAGLAGIVYAATRDDAAEAGFDDRLFHDLFTDPAAQWPTNIRRVDIADRLTPFEVWQRISEQPDD